MILSDRSIRARLATGNLGIDPITDDQIQPASVDLTVSDEVAWYYDGLLFRGPWGSVPDSVPFVLASTRETVRIPGDLAARVDGRSSLARLGVGIHVTAGFVDPGFEGQLTLEVWSARHDVPLRSLVCTPRVCQIVFYLLTAPVQQPYGPARGSHYQGQRGPTESSLARA